MRQLIRMCMLMVVMLGFQSTAQPLVGVVTTWNEAAPCNITLSRQAQAVKKGVAAANGTPVSPQAVVLISDCP